MIAVRSWIVCGGLLAASCTLRQVAVSDEDGGAGEGEDAAHTSESDGASEADAREALDAGGTDGGGAVCAPGDVACAPTRAPVPMADLWVAYWTADHGVETEPRPAAGGTTTYRAVRRWRSLVGEA